MRTISFCSNSDELAESEAGDVNLRHVRIGLQRGLRAVCNDVRAARDADVVVIVADTELLVAFCAWSLFRRPRFQIVSVDLIHGEPRSLWERCKTRIRGALLKRVNYFIVHQKDVSGYAKYLGVTPERTVYVPFKVNLWEKLERGEVDAADDGYLFLAGRTYRDIPLFVEACRVSGVPAIMFRHPPELALQHGTTMPAGPRPENLIELEDDGGRANWERVLARCRGIVLPILPGVINAAGISTLFDGFGLGKPVIITDCPATRGIVAATEAAIVPPDDAKALGKAMTQVYQDARYRENLARAGRCIADKLKGNARYHDDILRVIISRTR